MKTQWGDVLVVKLNITKTKDRSFTENRYSATFEMIRDEGIDGLEGERSLTVIYKPPGAAMDLKLNRGLKCIPFGWNKHPESKLHLLLEFEPKKIRVDPYFTVVRLHHKKLLNMKEKEPFSDVVLRVDKKDDVKGNRTSLATISPVFYDIFNNNLLETNTHVVEINEHVELNAVKEFVKFSETYETLSFTDLRTAWQLLYMAHEYKVEILQEMCLDYFQSRIEDDSNILLDLLACQLSNPKSEKVFE